MIYHILNGDALASILPDIILGERIIFRECLIDGPVMPTPTQELWEVRAEFINNNYPGSDKIDYRKYSYEELLKIKSIPTDSQIYLWFEEDLFCQVNLWFVLNYLKSHPADVYLVLPNPDSPYNFSALSRKELELSFQDHAHVLIPREREVMGTLWLHFQSGDVFEASKIANQFTERFPFLKPAVDAWRNMLPIGDSPGKPKAKLLEISKTGAGKNFTTLFREFQKELPEYGFGDVQVKRMCRELGIDC
jgi:hypothetical protein